LKYEIKDGRQLYFVLIEGSLTVNGVQLDYGDAVEVRDETQLSMQALERSHFLFIDMPAD
jgi:hypothetical protein